MKIEKLSEIILFTMLFLNYYIINFFKCSRFNESKRFKKKNLNNKSNIPYRRLYTIKHFVNILLKCMQQIFNANIIFLLLISYSSD